MGIQMGTYKIRILFKKNYSELLKVTFRKKKLWLHRGITTNNWENSLLSTPAKMAMVQ